MKRLFKTTFVDELRLKSLTQTETEVLLDALSLLAAVDGTVSPIEFASLSSGLSYLNWSREDLTCESFLEQRLSHHLRHRTEPIHIAEFADEMSAQLRERWIRETLFLCAARLSRIDDVVSVSEIAVEDVFAKAFGFSESEKSNLLDQATEVNR